MTVTVHIKTVTIITQELTPDKEKFVETSSMKTVTVLFKNVMQKIVTTDKTMMEMDSLIAKTLTAREILSAQSNHQAVQQNKKTNADQTHHVRSAHHIPSVSV